MDYIDSNVADRFISEANRRRCPKGPRGPIAPVPCDYCQHGKSLIEFGKPSDDDYLRVWIDKQGILQVRADAMGTVVYDTVLDNDGKELGICPMCGYMLGDDKS